MAAHAKGYQRSEEFIAKNIKTSSFLFCGTHVKLLHY
jgi:hypothetical protein